MRATVRPVRRFLIAQLVCILLTGIIVALFWGRTGFISVFLGGGVAMMNAVGTAFAWPRILDKKDIALPLSIIVSKFALSIGVFYWLTRPTSSGWFGGWFGPIWFGDQTTAIGSTSGTLLAFVFGLASVIPAALTVAIGDFSAEDETAKDPTDSSAGESNGDRNEQT